MKVILKGRGVIGGIGEGEALVTRHPISFLGGVDPLTGKVTDRSHELFGRSVARKVLIFPYGKGSTVGAYTLYALSKRGLGPVAIVNVETEPIIASGCAIAGIPLVDRLEEDPLRIIGNGDKARVDGTNGTVVVYKKKES